MKIILATFVFHFFFAISAVAEPAKLARPAKCPWKVVSVRASRSGEVAYEEATHYLRPGEWEARNDVPGPDGLVAHVRTHRGYSPYLLIENVHTGEDSVFIYPNVSLPTWSPDGKYVSSCVWTERTRGGKLMVFAVAGWKAVVDVDRTYASNTKWSPDSRRIVCAGNSYADGVEMVYSVTVPEGKLAVVDTTDVPGSIEFSWSPDSRWIAYSRPTKLHHVGDTMESDLWIADAITGEAWCLIKATDHNQSNPLWITDRTIQVDRVWWVEEGTNREQRVVVELGKSP